MFLGWLLLLAVCVYDYLEERSRRLEQCHRMEVEDDIRRREALLHGEQAQWVNHLLQEWWLHTTNINFDWIKESLDATLRDAKPGFIDSIEVTRFTLGRGTPQFRNIRTQNPISVGTPSRHNSDVCENGTRCSGSEGTEATTRFVKYVADFALPGDEFVLVVTSKLGLQGIGVDMDLAIENLHIFGRMLITVTMDTEVFWPHFKRISLSFLDRPNVWFNIRFLKTVQMMDVPYLKSWIHGLVLDSLTASMVDPFAWDIELSVAETDPLSNLPSSEPGSTEKKSSTADSIQSALSEGILFVSLHLEKPTTSPLPASVTFDLNDLRHVVDVASFEEPRPLLVKSLKTDVLGLKIKRKGLVRSNASLKIQLQGHGLESKQPIDVSLSKRSLDYIARLQYFPLPVFSADNPPPATAPGVLYIAVHCAEGLAQAGAAGTLNPYVMILKNGKKLKTSTYVPSSTSPTWNCDVETIVDNINSIGLSIAICSFEGKKSKGDFQLIDILRLDIKLEKLPIIKQRFLLQDENSTHSGSSASIWLSIIFRPVEVLAEINTTLYTPQRVTSENLKPPLAKRFSFPQLKDKDASNKMNSYPLHTGDGLMDFTILRARNLQAKDRNGFSDPFCELKLNGRTQFLSQIHFKTLNPKWEENVVTEVPADGQHLILILWDYDVIGQNDFLGSVTFSVETLRKIAENPQGEWFKLDGVKTGEVQIQVRILTDWRPSLSTVAEDEDRSGRNSVSSVTEEPSPAMTIFRDQSPEEDTTQLNSRSSLPPPELRLINSKSLAQGGPPTEQNDRRNSRTASLKTDNRRKSIKARVERSFSGSFWRHINRQSTEEEEALHSTDNKESMVAECAKPKPTMCRSILFVLVGILSIFSVFAARSSLARSSSDPFPPLTPLTPVHKRFTCPTPFFALGESCYFLRRYGTKNLKDAQAWCKQLAPNGKLAEFESKAEVHDMTQYLLKNEADCKRWGGISPWIGALENKDGKTFTWQISKQIVKYPTWKTSTFGKSHPNSPSAGDGVYLSCEEKFEWVDAPAKDEHTFICESDPYDSFK
ncbi:unnamed protein product [Cyprideis torosa]|uniref:Uncharacterized protein n=1 Tax=Cyprideis torosa TaxID=163714 RepID=A0A7R8ZS45_9CRUS|nr:unnamed protein product [Cyprideis torosa]CAG0894659.1 unnamed protein product [Cyprideis torosa]